MSRKKKLQKPYGRTREATAREVIDLVNGKRFYGPGEVVNEKDEPLGLSLTFFERGVPEEVAKRWSIHCLTDGRFQIVEW